MQMYRNDFYAVEINEAPLSLTYRTAPGDVDHTVVGPRLHVDGVDVEPEVSTLTITGPTPAGVASQVVVRGEYGEVPGLTLELRLLATESSPILRLSFRVISSAGHALTNGPDGNRLEYLRFAVPDDTRVTEVRFSEFNELLHSFCLSENPVHPEAFADGLSRMGPMLACETNSDSFLVAYEHGSEYPDAFIEFRLSADRTVAIAARKGNYVHAQPLSEGFDSVWFQFGAVRGSIDDLAASYREFQLRSATPNVESRRPFVFYNTWAYQERNKWWNGNAYLDSMNHDRILAEIDTAHRMGIEVFVLDTGWYEKTGDWTVSRERFPDGLAGVREALQSRGMKLGLWFNPRAAAVSSRMLAEHRDCIATRDGRPAEPRPIWETEESHSLCLVSRYWKAFADELIRLVNEVGVTYFKWDAIGQYGCDSPDHYHGTAANTAEERWHAYAFELQRYMSKVIDRLCAACPEAIVDFDITEGTRAVGLGFLSSGKYFLINNGPYFHNYDLPQDEKTWSNIFVHPGAARTWIGRSPLDFDRWIPSVLFLTHYIPDDPADSQLLNIASLILGQNGIWGDLLSVSDEGVKRFGRLLGLYKQVREDITRATPVRSGRIGARLEIHEKVDPDTGRGAVVLFAADTVAGAYTTRSVVSQDFVATDGVDVAIQPSGRARITVGAESPSAAIVFFGAQ